MNEDKGMVRRQNVVLDLPAHPASPDSLHRAIKDRLVSLVHKDMIDGELSTYITMLGEHLSESEWFDFGRIDADDLGSAASDSSDILKEGMALPPYKRCVFRLRMTSGEGAMETVMVIERQEKGVLVQYFRIVGLHADHMILTAGVRIDKNGFYRIGESEQQSEVCGKLYGGQAQAKRDAQAREGADPSGIGNGDYI